MTADELKSCVENHPKNASQIAADLGISTSGMSKWLNGKRKIDDRDAKLLRLYFHGETPFEHLREEEEVEKEKLAAAMQNLVLHPTREQYRRWEEACQREAAKQGGIGHLEDWATKGLDELAARWEVEKQAFPEQKSGNFPLAPLNKAEEA